MRSTIFLTRHNVVAPALSLPEAAAALVLGAARTRGPIARDEVAQHTSLSIATVNRQITALQDAGLLRERPDLAASGASGRPRVPVEVNHEPYLTLGLHIGARTTSIVATDLLGRTLDMVETPTPHTGQTSAVAAPAASARRYLGRRGAVAGQAAVRPRDRVDQPVHLRSRDRRLRARDRRAGAQPRHRAGQHRSAGHSL